MFDFIDTKTLFVIVHLLGVALGVGGAIISDLMFFKTVRDKRIASVEMSFLTLGSTVVWAGLGLLIASGLGMFLLDPSGYLASTKFLAKMTIVGILTVNAVFFHALHIPRLKRHVEHHFPSSDEFMRGRISMLVSGVVSIVSWVTALILGALSAVPYPYVVIMAVYLVVIVFGVCIALLNKDRFIPGN